MRFSALARDLPGTTNRLYDRVEALRSERVQIVDLIRADVAAAGAVFPQNLLAQILTSATRRAERYAPDSMGQRVAREAIAAYERVRPDDVLLTPGTSLSYSYLFKLLCEAGDEILCPLPAYPLFDYIARLEGVRITHYGLEEDHGWRIDLENVEEQITERTRAIVLISPHNPTGVVLESAEVSAISAIAAKHDLPIIADEVFREFVFEDADPARPATGDAPLVFSLNGFSKMFALPGFKMGWIAVGGQPALVKQSLATLEMVSDTFLPVSEIAQFAVPEIFKQGQAFLEAYRKKVEACRYTALSALGETDMHPPAGGFYLVVPYSREVDEEDLVVELLEEEGVLLHPGYFYEIEGRHVVLSFVNRPDTLKQALTKVRTHL